MVRLFLDPFVLLAVLVGIVLVSLGQIGSVPETWWTWWYVGGAAARARAGLQLRQRD